MAIEAVIISGPRKGEFITVGEEITEEPAQMVVDQLGAALKELDAALVAVLEEARAWRAALRDERGDRADG